MPCAAHMEENFSKFIVPSILKEQVRCMPSELFDVIDYNSIGPKFNVDIYFGTPREEKREIFLEELIEDGKKLIFVHKRRDGRKT